MIDNANKDDLIEQYLLGELKGDLLIEFKEKLATDNQFRNEVAIQKAIIRNIKAVGRKGWLQKLNNFHNEIEFGNIGGENANLAKDKIIPAKRFYRKKYFLAVAATLVFIILSTLVIRTINNEPSPEGVFMAYYEPYPALEQDTRTVPSTQTRTLTGKQEAFRSYNDGNYSESIRLFNNILIKKDDEIVLFYLGNSYLSSNKPKDAESIFKKYLKKYKEFTTESKWYLSLSYLKQGKIKDARKLLQQLAKEDNDYSKKAKEVLNKM